MVESSVNALDSASPQEKSESANITNSQTSHGNRSNSESSLTGAHFAANDRASANSTNQERLT